MSSLIGALRVSLGLDTAAFDKGAREATSSLGKMQRTMSKAAGAIGTAFLAAGVGELVTAFRDAGKQAVDTAGSLGETAAALGVGTEALQVFRFAATQVGLSTEQMDQALGQFSKRLGAAELSGKGPFVAALKEIGLTLDDLKGKSETEQIGLIADGINKAGSAAEQSALQVAFFGKTGQATATLLQGGSAGIKAFADEARKLGVVLSEGDIAKADETADKLAKLNYVIEAQQNKKLLENSEAIVKYEEAVGNLKLAAISAVGGLEDANQRYNKWALEFNQHLRHAINAAIDFQKNLAGNLGRAAVGALAAMVNLGRDIVLGLARGIKQNGSAVWEALKGVVTGGIAKAKGMLGIKSPSRVFMEIGDYIAQGLAIGIEGGTGQVAAATSRLTEAARRAAEETKSLFARLFPELDNANQYREDLARIEASGRSEDAKSEARYRLAKEFAAATGHERGDLEVITADAADNITDDLDKVMGRFDLFGRKAGTVSVAVAKSFKDMADATVQSLQNLASAVRGGGFLDILSAVVGLGLQLGSIGVFGKNVAARINAPKTPAYARGTNFHPGGLAMVGERGPELVDLPRGSRVWPNGTGPGATQRVEIFDTTGLFRFRVDGQIVQAAPAIMDGGARIATSRSAYQQRRRVA